MSDRTAFEVGRLYQPIKTIADTLVASQKDIFVRLPGLVGYWPSGIRAASGQVVEHGGSGFNLFQTGACPVGFDGNSFAHLGNGTNFVWSSSTQLGLTGTETWISSSIRGLTVGAWFMVDTSPTISTGLMGKDGVASDRGYAVDWLGTNAPRFGVSGTGGAVVLATGGVQAIGQWIFIVGRFIPSTEVSVIVNGDKSVNTTAVPASVFGSSQNFEVGRYFNDNTRIIHGKVRDAFLCASALSDEVIEELRVTSVP